MVRQMKDKNLPVDEADLFREAFADVKPLTQDTVRHQHKNKKAPEKLSEPDLKKVSASFYFSDEFVPELSGDGPLSWVKEGENAYYAKQLRRGDFYPDIILDLHGLTKEQTKLELAAMLEHCVKQNVQCACIVHGIGERVLKHKLPHWLVQHPAILAFHQAPLEWGGKGALLILIETENKP